MVKSNENFVDPLDEIDPIMDDAFSVTSDANDSDNLDSDAEAFSESNQKVDISEVQFPEVDSAFQGKSVETGLFADLPVKVSVELGRSTISLKEIFELTEGSIIELDRLVGEPLDLVVNGQIVAKGEVVAIDNNFGLRIKSIVNKIKV
jgi:flagellar motor switch protein FliN